LIVARAVSRRFGSAVALHEADFELRRGEIVALAGPNGAGKSTLLAILAGALRPSSGTVARAVDVGWAPQRAAVYARLTPAENVNLFARLRRVDAGSLDLPERPVGELSVGERQRLNLALAFLGAPPALVLDEPTSALDAERREELWQRLEAQRSVGGAVVATQSPEEERRADRIVRIAAGRLAR